MKAYVVSCALEVLVVAASPDEARRIGCDVLDDCLANELPSDLKVDEARSLPFGWIASDLVYGTEEDTTAAEALKLNKEGAGDA